MQPRKNKIGYCALNVTKCLDLKFLYFDEIIVF